MRYFIEKIPKISKFLATISVILATISVTSIVLVIIAFSKNDISMIYIVITLLNSITVFACLIILIKQDLKLKK